MNIYRLNSETGEEQGFIETSASEEIIQESWNKVRSDVYFFEERRYIENINAGVTGTKSVNELVKLLEFKQIPAEILETGGESIINIDATIVELP